MAGRTRTHTQIIGLDLLRLAAALLVMAYHFGFWEWTNGQDLLRGVFGHAPAGGARLHFGWVGVEIFFVISGFVIASSAEGATAAAFLRSRVLRLIPGVWICATISLLLLATAIPPSGRSLIPAYLCTLTFWPFRAIDGVYWTLGVEVSFYMLVYGLLRMNRLALLERSMVVLGLGSGLFWAAALLLMHTLQNRTGAAGTLHMLVMHAQGNRELQLVLAQHACLFGFGVVQYRAFTSGLTRGRALALTGLGAACMLELIGQTGIIARASGQSLSPLPAMIVWGAAMAAFSLAVACNDRLTRGLGGHAGGVRFLGKLTYPLYLVHNQVVLAVALLLAPALGLYAIAFGMAAAIVVAGLVERYPERLLRRMLAARVPAGDRPALAI